MLRVSMHQPNFLPYVGFFDKIAKSDLFVMVDHCTFSKGKDNWHQRNRIRTGSEQCWDYVTVPVSEHYNWKPFHEARISDCFGMMKRKHFRTMQINYHNAPFFNEHFDEFWEIYNHNEKDLTKFNTSLILWFLERFKIKTKVLFSTDLDFDERLKKDDMIIALMKDVNGTHFLSGDGAKTYIQPQIFSDAGIELEFQDFKPEKYPQVYHGFIPNLSAFDVLMNTGKLVPNGHNGSE